jgi:hypothetical protein
MCCLWLMKWLDVLFVAAEVVGCAVCVGNELMSD